jgi:hypothetical protein
MTGFGFQVPTRDLRGAPSVAAGVAPATNFTAFVRMFSAHLSATDRATLEGSKRRPTGARHEF